MHYVRVFVLLSFWVCASSWSTTQDYNVEAESVILMNADSGAILYEKNARTLQYPASITKIATALYVLHQYSDKLDSMLTADPDAIASVTEEAKRRANFTLPAYRLVPGSSHIGIKKGEELSLRDLLYAMMISSANDAANVIAQNLGDTIPEFMNGVNGYLKEIGCKQTTFCNPHGIYYPKHQTTAYDMAVMTSVALRNPLFREIVATTKYPRPKTNKQESTTLVQTNRLLKKGKHYYDKAIGVKTGYIALAGHTLVAAAKQGDRTLVAVLLKTKERDDIFRGAIQLFETAFNQPKVQKVLLKSGPQKFALDMPGASQPIATMIQEDVAIDYYPAEEPSLKCLLYWNSTKLPVMKDQCVGKLQVQTLDGKVLKTVPLFAQEDVKPSAWWYLKHKMIAHSKWIGAILVISLLAGLVWIVRK